MEYLPNDTSILVLVKNPQNVNELLVSLNGDALGLSILEIVQDKPLKIFKVSHHGSVHNSLPLNYDPAHKKDTEKLLAAEALLDLAEQLPVATHLPHKPLAYKSLGNGGIKQFNKKFGLKKSDDIIKFEIKPLSLDDILSHLATAFLTAIKARKITVRDLLDVLRKGGILLKQILMVLRLHQRICTM